MMCQKNTSNAHTSETKWEEWAALNPDLLYIIFRKLCDITDLIMFRAVCKDWRNATNLSVPPPLFPCLIRWAYVHGSILRVYSPASQRSHISQVPNTSFLGLVGPIGHDMLIKSHSGDYYSYLNPLTRVKKNIPYTDPSLIYIPKWNRPFEPGHFEFNLRTDKFHIQCTGGSCHSFFCWTSEPKHVWFDELKSAVYYKNQYFLLEKTINDDCKVAIIEDKDKPELSWIPCPNNSFGLNYLVATTDHLLLVSASIPRYIKDQNKSRFEVHRLDNYPQNPYWTKLSGIGDVMLFLDHRSCFSLMAGDYCGVKGNCIYFIGCRKPRCGIKEVIGRYEMGLNKFEELSGPAWFDMGPNSLSTTAAWFVPSL